MEASRNPKYIQDRKRSGEEKKLGSTPEKTLLALIRNMDPLLTNEEKWQSLTIVCGSEWNKNNLS